MNKAKNKPKKIGEGKKKGRPKIEVDFDVVKQLCRIQCTGEEIALVIGVNYDTLNTRIKEKYKVTFSEYYKKESENGKSSLRRAQFKAALGGNVSMLIWLGKNYLGQKEPDKAMQIISEGVNGIRFFE